MSNSTALDMCVFRAIRTESERKTFNEPLSISVPTLVIMFANNRIKELENEVARLQKQLSGLVDTDSHFMGS